jgi:hypothetical protein
MKTDVAGPGHKKRPFLIGALGSQCSGFCEHFLFLGIVRVLLRSRDLVPVIAFVSTTGFVSTMGLVLTVGLVSRRTNAKVRYRWPAAMTGAFAVRHLFGGLM